MLIDRDVSAAKSCVKQTMSELVQNKVDLLLLIIFRYLFQTDSMRKQPHAILAERIRKRDPGSAPALRDRVRYVMIKGAKCTSLFPPS